MQNSKQRERFIGLRGVVVSLHCRMMVVMMVVMVMVVVVFSRLVVICCWRWSFIVCQHGGVMVVIMRSRIVNVDWQRLLIFLIRVLVKVREVVPLWCW